MILPTDLTKLSHPVECGKCGTVHMSVTLEFAVLAVKEYNEYLKTQFNSRGIVVGPTGDSENYTFCRKCGETFRNFKDVIDSPFPVLTIAPILLYSELAEELH